VTAPEPIVPEELLARYLLQRSDFTASTNRVSPARFIPQNGALSVFRTEGLAEEAVWQIGQTYVALRPDQTIRARADFRAQRALDEGLRINPDNEPERHASITGWPETKPERLAIAIKLAQSSALVLAPPRESAV
jgi:hypothetical protein